MDLSIIILNYNTKDITSKCLTHVKKAKEFCEKKLKNEQSSSSNKTKVIVLDNASSDSSVKEISENFPWVKLIKSKENTGFSKGNNIVMKKVKTPYILLLNSDVYLSEDCLYKALAYFRVNKNCDVLGGGLKYGSGVLQPSAGNLPNPLNLIFWIFGISLISVFDKIVPAFHPKTKNYFSFAHRVGWIMGAFFMLKKEIFDTTGGFDENLFMHMEEIEWCKRIKEKGYKIWYVPHVEAIHLHGASSCFDLTNSFLQELSGIKYYFNKHYPDYYIFMKLFLRLGLILRIIAFYVLNKKQRAETYLKGLKVI